MNAVDLHKARIAYEMLENGSLELAGFRHNPTASDLDAKSCETGEETDNVAVSLSFREFLGWYASNRFNKKALRNKQQERLLHLAKKHGLDPSEVERIQSCYDLYNVDGSGRIQFTTFRDIV